MVSNSNYNPTEATEANNRGVILADDNKDDKVLLINNSALVESNMVTATTINLDLAQGQQISMNTTNSSHNKADNNTTNICVVGFFLQNNNSLLSSSNVAVTPPDFKSATLRDIHVDERRGSLWEYMGSHGRKST